MFQFDLLRRLESNLDFRGKLGCSSVTSGTLDGVMESRGVTPGDFSRIQTSSWHGENLFISRENASFFVF